MAGYFQGTFPYGEVGRFQSVQEAVAEGWSRNQIWSVAICGDTWSYGPAHHTMGIDHYIATAEQHDGDTYYEDDGSEDEDE